MCITMDLGHRSNLSAKVDEALICYHTISICYDAGQVKNCSSTKEENLTPDEILHLHQMCSMRRSCEDLSLLQRSRHKLSTHYGIFVDYTCIDTAASVVNMCQGGEWNINDIVHIVFNGTSIRSSIQCSCYIKDGTFELKLNDVRLIDKSEKRCSFASLHVNSQKFFCNEDHNNFGSIFNKKIDITKNAYIGVNSSITDPDMVWLKIEPKGNSTITVTCEKPKVSYVSSKYTAPSTTDHFSLYSSTLAFGKFTSADHKGPGRSINRLEVIIIVLCLIFLLSFVVLMVIGWHLYAKHKRTSQAQDSSRNKDGTESDETPEQFELRSPGLSDADRERVNNDMENQSDDYYSLANIRETDFQTSKVDKIYDTTQNKHTLNRKAANYDHLPYFKK